MSESFLQMRSITKTFPGVKALDQVNMDCSLGEVHALLGENGAGKSTLVKILSGAYTADAGEIHIDGQRVSFNSTKDAEAAGIAIIYQELNLIPEMTVAENVFLGREITNRFGLINYRRMNAEAAKELAELDVDIQTEARVGDLRVGEQQLVEIAKALSLHARILIMDEPSSALSETEVKKLFTVIERLRTSGVGIIYITHKLDEIFAIAQKVTVLRDGQYIGTREVKDTTSDELINMMVGRELTELYPKESTHIGEELLRVDRLTVRDKTLSHKFLLQDINFSLRRGEILGIAGLMGAGRSELLLTLFGSPPGPVLSGQISIHGQKKTIRSPVDAIRNRMALVTEDRKVQGLFMQLSVGINITIANLKQATRRWLLRRSLERRMIGRFVDKLNIKTPNPMVPVETLSGGNQQKVILAKWLLTRPEILLLDDPTRGIDVGAKAEIYEMMNRFAEQGMGIIMVSSELPEVLAMSDRILVLSQGRITGEFTRNEATEQRIMAAATGAGK